MANAFVISHEPKKYKKGTGILQSDAKIVTTVKCAIASARKS